MTYKLALALKRAGFPQKSKNQVIDGKFGKPELVAKPTLEELIDACGDEKGFELSEETGSWKAVVNYPELEMARGKTPTESVAKLWLKLNEKK